MATWVTHLMIADKILEYMPQLDRHGFCVGNIAPDCNIENDDWTDFDPPRAVTHWMGGERKKDEDCERFFDEMIRKRMEEIDPGEELSFLLGYYVHLIADAQFQRMIRDEERIKAMWKRIHADPELSARTESMEKTWDAAKKLFSKAQRFREREIIEAEYLEAYPQSGYRTEILALEYFPDYLDYMPEGCIVRKIDVMGDVPRRSNSDTEPICISREEYMNFVEETVKLALLKLREHKM